MLSRDADACYWIGRYVERAEATARMVDVHYHAALESYLPSNSPMDEPEPISSLRWQSLLAISGSDEIYQEKSKSESDREALHFFAFDTENPNSILSTWKLARENARAMREQLSSEMWESINITYLRLLEYNPDETLATVPHEFFQMVKNASHLVQGILNRTMVMGETRDWLDMGRFSERGDQTTRLLDVKYHALLPSGHSTVNGNDRGGPDDPLDTHEWIAVLKSVSAFEMYRKTHREGIKPEKIVDFLTLNRAFPASVRHCAGRVEGCLRRISGSPVGSPPNEPERLVGRLLADLTYLRADEIIDNGLHQFLDGVQDTWIAIGNSINQTFLSY